MTTIEDDFSSYKNGSDGSPMWDADPVSWEVRDGKYHVDGTIGGFAQLARGPMYRRISVEATVELQEAVSMQWKVASVCIVRDPANYWHFALVEAPQAQGKFHFVELAERRDDIWLAQANLRQTAAENTHFDWRYGTPYRLRITMTPEGIEGALSDIAGKTIARIGYAFDDVAVTSGYGALRCSGFIGDFDDVKITADAPIPRPQPEQVTWPPYNVEACDLFSCKATGFFHTHKRDGVWWIIDPKGRPFYVIGTDHFRFGGHWCEKLGYAPYKRNMERKFGTPEAWAADATARLKDWGFNLIGAGGGREAFYRGLAHTAFVAFGSNFSSVSDICPKVYWTGFPNVFHPKWEAYCDRRARTLCGPNRGDPWLLGYFLDNELEWYGKSHTEWGLFDDAMKKEPDHSAKVALVAFLRDRYGTVARFNQAWGTHLSSFASILRRHSLDGPRQERVRADKKDFVRLCAEKYFKACAEAIRKNDPNHMVLGCRFAGGAPAQIWDIAGKYCDIVSFNYYGRVDLDRWEVPKLPEYFTKCHELARKPLMITEWSFPALDSGLPCLHGAGERFDTQEQRAQAFEIYQTMLFRLPFMVGSDFFMWVDEPALGISSTFPEDTNYGLVNEQDEPYPELTATAKRVNKLACKVHNQDYPEIAVLTLKWADGTLRATVENRGKASARVHLRLIVDGETREATVPVASGGVRNVRLHAPLRPGQHLIVLEADPEHLLVEGERGDNRLIRMLFVPGSAENLRGAIARVSVANPTPEPLGLVPVTIPIEELPSAARNQRQLVAEGKDSRSKPVQRDDVAGEICFIADPLPPWGCHTYVLRPSSKIDEPAAVRLNRKDGAFSIDNGSLELVNTGDTGDFFNAIKLAGTMAGRYNPLVWQEVNGQSYWVKTSEFVGAEFDEGPVRLVADLTARGGPGKVITKVDEKGRPAQQVGQPQAFEVRHRIVVYPGRNWFAAKFLSIKNLSTRPLKLRGYFFYLNSLLGGDDSGDAPGGPKIPNYYLQPGAAWKDEALGLWLGAIPQEGSDLQADFWLDEAGGQHPDVRRSFQEPVVLAPGQTYSEENAPWLYVYAGKGEAPWKPIKQTLRRLDALKVQVW